MPTPAGRRDKLITFQRLTAVQDEYGEPIETWAPIGTARAAVYFGGGNERRQAAREQGEQAAEFVALSSAKTRGLTIRDRIQMGADDWDIVGSSPDTPKRGEITFTAKRAL